MLRFREDLQSAALSNDNEHYPLRTKHGLKISTGRRETRKEF